MQVQDDKPYDDINITPMLDLAYVLLVIFILMCTATVQGLKVKLPTSTTKAPSLARPKTKSVTVDASGRVYLDTIPVSLTELESGLAAAKAKVPELPVIVRGDRDTQYKGVKDVIDVLGRLGLNEVGLVTKSAK